MTTELVRRYVQLHNIGPTRKNPEAAKIDAVSILSFACVNDVEDYLVSEDCGEIETSEMVLPGEGSEFGTAITYGAIDRLAPEGR